jgi:hypothetical protein
MKDTIAYIETEKRTYPFVFNLNVMEEIQEQYGSLDAWGEKTQGEGEPNIKDLKNGVMAMINEGIDIENENNGTNEPFVDTKKVGRIISEVGMQKILTAIQKLTVASTKTEGDAKNE